MVLCEMWTRLTTPDRPQLTTRPTLVVSFRITGVLPWNPPRLHLVGHRNVGGPDVVLPALLTQDPPQDCATVHANAHVNIGLGFLSDVPAGREAADVVKAPSFFPSFSHMTPGGVACTHDMASTMARPIMMEQGAWSSL